MKLLLFVNIFLLSISLSNGQNPLEDIDFEKFQSRVINDAVPLKMQGLTVINFDYVEFDTSIIHYLDSLNVLEVTSIINSAFKNESNEIANYKKVDNPIVLKTKSTSDSTILFDYGFRLKSDDRVLYAVRVVSGDSIPFYIYNLVQEKEKWYIQNLSEHQIFLPVLTHFNHDDFAALYDKDSVGTATYNRFKKKCFSNKHLNLSLLNSVLKEMDNESIRQVLKGQIN